MGTRRLGVVAIAAALALSACSDIETGIARSAPHRKKTVAAPSLKAAPRAAATRAETRRRSKAPRVDLIATPAKGEAAFARTTSGCAKADHKGGDWPSLNGDFTNSRAQPAEHGLNPATLQPVWSFKGGDIGITGGERSTPIVANGCVYLAFGMGYLGDRGDVVALNADTGKLVWHARFDASVLGLAARNGLIYVTPSRGTRGTVPLPVVTADYKPAGSYAAALNAETGKLVWTSARLDDGDSHNGTFINASPVVFEAGGRRIVFVPLAGGAGDGARVPMYFIDAMTGATITRAYALSDAEYRAGYGGTGIWSTAAYDPSTQLLYAGTADSDGYTKQHPYNNALLKIDANPSRPSFAKVVGAYTGTTEHANLDALIGYPHNPLCQGGSTSQLNLPTFFDTSASPECLELDFDFGASPNLVRHNGRLVITALQKSGVFHAVDAQTMKADWTFWVGPGGPAQDSVTAAIDGDAIYVGATPNPLFRLNKNTGAAEWIATTGFDVFAYQPVTYATGVVYTLSDIGVLTGVSARNGAPVLNRLVSADGGFPQCIGVGGGIAIARNTLYAPCDAGGLVDLAGLPASPGGLVAYR